MKYRRFIDTATNFHDQDTDYVEKNIYQRYLGLVRHDESITNLAKITRKQIIAGLHKNLIQNAKNICLYFGTEM